MRVMVDGEMVTLCDGCGTRLDGRENANKSLAAYGSSASGRFVVKTSICRTKGTACLGAHAGGLTAEEAVAAYRAELTAAGQQEAS
jgi:hypothetical protein